MTMLKRLALAALLLLGLFLPAPKADATILFAGGEDVDFQLIGTVTTSTSATFYRSGYGRLALGITANTVTDPPSNRIMSPVFANQQIIWIHAETYQASTASTSLNFNPLSVYGSDGNPHLMIRGTATTGQVKIAKETTAGVYTDLVTCTSGIWPAISLHKLDLFVNYAVSGEVTLYIDGASACDFVGDVTSNGITAVNQVSFAGTNINTSTDYWSEIIGSTSDTRAMSLCTLAPSTNGTTMAWSGTVANVNGTNYNDTNPITTGSSAQIAEFNTGTCPAGSFTVPAVIQSARVEVGTSGPQHFSYTIRPGSGSTDYQSANANPTTAFANYQNIWATNPATSAGWTNGDIVGIQYGIESQP
jgi:hypothetical protein